MAGRPEDVRRAVHHELTRLTPADVRAFVTRDRVAVKSAKDAYWSERKARLGLTEVLRVADQLRDQARAIDPTWPSEADREADLQAHRRLAALLAKVPDPPKQAAASNGRTASVRRLRGPRRRS